MRQREKDGWAGDDNVTQPLLGLAELILQLSALGDVEECDHGADHLAVAANRVGPILGGEAGPVRTPENFVST